jgi:hypothetical protein
VSDESNRALREAFEREVDLTEELQGKVEELTNELTACRSEQEIGQAKVEELTYLVTELDAHEGAEGWSADLENRLKIWRSTQEDE